MHDICPNSVSMARTKELPTICAKDSSRENNNSLLNGDSRMCPVPPQGVLKGLNTSFAPAPDPPSSICRNQLSSVYHGIALWHPSPLEGFNHISIGDVGYLNEGAFIRIFNATLPRDDPSNKFIEISEGYKPLKRQHSNNVRRSEVRQEEYYSHVSKVDNVRANTHDK
jgi:hypothetical protein